MTGVIVAGAGIAGAAAAGLLARRGLDVLVVDRDVGPGPAAAESLAPGALRVFAELGLSDRVREAGWRRNPGSTQYLGPGRPPWRSIFGGVPGHGYHVDRTDLRELLRRRAVELGARFRTAEVAGPLCDEAGAVTGVRLADGSAVEARAVVDATGVSRAVADGDGVSRAADSVLRARLGGVRIADAADRDHCVVAPVAGTATWCWLTPLAEDHLEIGRLERGAPTGAAPADWRACLRGTELDGLIEGTPVVLLPTVAERWTYPAPAAGGPGWAAAGDAAGVVEPVLSATSTLALLGAQAVAAAVAADALPTYTERYQRLLDVQGRYADIAFAGPDLPTVDAATRLLELTNSPATGGAVAHLREAMEGLRPLIDVAYPDGPVNAYLN